MTPRKLTTMARWLKENCPELDIIFSRSYTSTDRQPRGMRYITHKGKGKHGHLLELRRDEDLLLSHDSSHTYRTNDEVVRYVTEYLEGRGRRAYFSRLAPYPAQPDKLKAWCKFLGAKTVQELYRMKV